MAALGELGAAPGELVRARNLRETLAALSSSVPALVVLDPLVPGGATELGELARLEPAPALLLVVGPGETALGLERLASAALGPGDVIRRDAPPAEFGLRIERLLAQVELERELVDLRHRALHDDRTDLLRPQAFEQRLGEHFSAAERHRLPMALVILDLDHFGAMNKRRDHVFGDLVITRVGGAIRSTLRTEDVAGRLGGDEFAVILPYTRPLDAARVVRRLRDGIHELTGELIGSSSELVISASLGFETFDGSDLASVVELRAHAEVALREAKNRGGNRAVYHKSLAR